MYVLHCSFVSVVLVVTLVSAVSFRSFRWFWSFRFDGFVLAFRVLVHATKTPMDFVILAPFLTQSHTFSKVLFETLLNRRKVQLVN